MEGLIPIMFRAIKRSQTRRQYECISSGAAQTYNIADFYVTSSVHGTPVTNAYMHGDRKDVSGGKGHRRCNSVGSFAYSGAEHEFDGGVGAKKQHQLKKFRSQRMFSCLTGTT